jgi:hypothetical protein
MVVHRRGGKTVACVHDLVIKALYTQKTNARFGYVAPFRQQAKEIAWTYLKDATEGLRDGPPRESELRVKLPNGAWITLYGADNPDALRGVYFDGLILDEFGDMRPSLMGEVIMPTLADRKGWMAVIGTPKGRNQFFELARKAETDPNWYFKHLPASTSGILSESDLDEIRLEMSKEEYEQEMECSFEAALKGTYYTTLMNDAKAQGRMGQESLYDPEQKVFVAADLGYSDTCAWWFWQPRQDGMALIDYYQSEGKDLKHYLEMLAQKQYDYQEIWLPHDAKAKTLQTGRSIVEQLLFPYRLCPQFYPANTKMPIRIVPKLKVQDGIEAARLVIPSCWFDLTNCFQGIEALRNYRRQYHEHTQTFSNTPLHDWSSNGSDAFRYFALVCKGSKGQSAEAHLNRDPRGNRAWKPSHGTLNELWQANEKSQRRLTRRRF